MKDYKQNTSKARQIESNPPYRENKMCYLCD